MGHRVRAGDEIMMVLGAANRDPAVFADPHRLDVTRDARRHVAFGGGIHHCLGATLARVEGHVALHALLARFPHMAVAGTPTRRPTFTLRGLESLPVLLLDNATRPPQPCGRTLGRGGLVQVTGVIDAPNPSAPRSPAAGFGKAVLEALLDGSSAIRVTSCAATTEQPFHRRRASARPCKTK